MEIIHKCFALSSTFRHCGGWLGGPNGMIRYQGIYHVFWWGHAESEDLVFWNERPYPMVGDDGSFIYFSGSVVVDENNTTGFARGDQVPMVAFYTLHERGTKHETQGISINNDYTTFTYYENNPLLDAEEEMFRDPRVFFHEESNRAKCPPSTALSQHRT